MFIPAIGGTLPSEDQRARPHPLGPNVEKTNEPLLVIDMVELVPENLEELRPVTPSFSIEGSTIIPSSKTNPRKVKEISDIMTWVEAFTSYISVMSAYFPHRARDLLAYMALVMRTEKRYGGSAWRHYDRAFRRSP